MATTIVHVLNPEDGVNFDRVTLEGVTEVARETLTVAQVTAALDSEAAAQQELAFKALEVQGLQADFVEATSLKLFFYNDWPEEAALIGAAVAGGQSSASYVIGLLEELRARRDGSWVDPT